MYAHIFSNVLKTIKYPGFSRDIISFGIVNKISVDPDNNLNIDIHRINDFNINIFAE